MHLTRHEVRYIGAAAAGAMALIYFLIGFGVLDIGGSASGEMVDLAMFGYSAGLAFLAIGLLLVFTDRRWLWVLALVFQVFVYLIYVGTSGGRSPQFETWGITLRIIQLALVTALAYLSLRAPEHKSIEAHT